MFKVEMTKYLILITFILVQGCAIYPKHHISFPEIEGNIASSDYSEVSVKQVGWWEPSCKSRKYSSNIDKDGNFRIPANYDWLKLIFFVPSMCSASVQICFIEENKKETKVFEKFYMPCNLPPEKANLSCAIEGGNLVCNFL